MNDRYRRTQWQQSVGEENIKTAIEITMLEKENTKSKKRKFIKRYQWKNEALQTKYSKHDKFINVAMLVVVAAVILGLYLVSIDIRIGGYTLVGAVCIMLMVNVLAAYNAGIKEADKLTKSEQEQSEDKKYVFLW